MPRKVSLVPAGAAPAAEVAPASVLPPEPVVAAAAEVAPASVGSCQQSTSCMDASSSDHAPRKPLPCRPQEVASSDAPRTRAASGNKTVHDVGDNTAARSDSQPDDGRSSQGHPGSNDHGGVPIISLNVLIGSAEEQRLDYVDAAAARTQSAESFARADLPDFKLMVFLQTTKVQREEQTHGIDGLLNHGIDSLFKKSVYTVYEIKCRKHHREWSVFRRYSQFQEICAKVQLMGKTQRRRTLTARSAEFEQELRDACAEIVKELPKKTVWDRLAPNVVELRRIGLQVRQATSCTDSHSTLGGS